MSQTSAIPWAELKRIGGTWWVLVYAHKIFDDGGAPPTVGYVAERLAMEPDRLLDIILRKPQNKWAVSAIYDKLTRDRTVRGNAKSLGAKRREMRIAAFRSKGVPPFDWFEVSGILWGIPNVDDKPLLVPLEPAFKKILDEKAEKQARNRQLQAIKPSLEALEKQLDDIFHAAAKADREREVFKSSVEKPEQSLYYLMMLKTELEVMVENPKESFSNTDRESIEAVKKKLDQLINDATKAFLTEPALPEVEKQLKERDEAMRALWDLFNDDEFEKKLKIARENWALVPFKLQGKITNTLTANSQCVAQSDKAEDFRKLHVEPMLNVLASAKLERELSKTPKSKYRDFNDGLFTTLGPPASSSVYVTIALIAVTPQVVGNFPGPASVAMSTLDVMGSVLLNHVIKSPPAANKLAGKMLRGILAVTRPGPIQARTISGAVISLKYSNIKALDFSANFMTGRAITGIVGVCCLACFALAVTSDNRNTLEGWANIMASGTGAVLTMSVALSRLAVLNNSKVMGALARGITGKALGVIAGFASSISGFVDCVDEANEGNIDKAWISGISATGMATLSAGGFLMAFGLAAEATVVGIPVGIGLQLVGGLVSVVATIVSVVEEATTPGTEIVFKHLLMEDFSKKQGPFDRAKRNRPSLETSLNAVKIAHYAASYWEINLNNGGQNLADSGFDAKAIAIMTDTEEEEVKATVDFPSPKQ